MVFAFVPCNKRRIKHLADGSRVSLHSKYLNHFNNKKTMNLKPLNERFVDENYSKYAFSEFYKIG